MAWWDRRDDPGLNAGFGNVYYTASTDNGNSWLPNARITDRLVDRRIGVFGNNFDVWAPPA